MVPLCSWPFLEVLEVGALAWTQGGQLLKITSNNDK